MNSVKWSGEVENIKSRLTAGVSLETIARNYGVSRQRLYQVLTKFGLQTHIRRKKNFLRHRGPKIYWLNQKLTIKKIPHELRRKLLDTMVLPEYCPVLGIKLDYEGRGIKRRWDDSPSIDQIVPGAGYTESNMIVVSWRANRIKNDGTPKEHRKIYEFYDALGKKI